MPPDRRTRNPTIVRVRWQRRTAAIPMGTVQAVIQNAADHFRLNEIVEELVLVAVIDDEELELTSNTLKLLAKDAVVVLKSIAEPQLGREVPMAQKSESPAPPPTPPQRLDRPPGLPSRPTTLKARSPSPGPSAGSCKCTVCVRAARQQKPSADPIAPSCPPRHTGGRNVKAEALDDDTMSIFVVVYVSKNCQTFAFPFTHVLASGSPNHPMSMFSTLPSATGQEVLTTVAQRLQIREGGLSLFSANGHPISLKKPLLENGIRDGETVVLRYGLGRSSDRRQPGPLRRVIQVPPQNITTVRLDGVYRGPRS